MIKCCYCGLKVRVVQNGSVAWLEAHGNCRGSNACVRGNWRDDPTYRAVDFTERIAKLMSIEPPTKSA